MLRIILLLIIFIGLLAGSNFANNQGYVAISIANITIEMSLTVLGIFICAILVILWIIEHLLKTWRNAQKQRYLDSQLTIAQKHISNNNFADAIVTLETLNKTYPNNYLVLHWLKKLYKKENKWKQITEILPSLLKNKIVTKEKVSLLKRQATIDNLATIAVQQGVNMMLVSWKQLPRATRKNVHTILSVSDLLIAKNSHQEALDILLPALKSLTLHDVENKLGNISLPDLKKYYHQLAQLRLNNVSKLVKALQKKAKAEPNNAYVHSTLAHILFNQGNWIDAQTHFELALKLNANLYDYSFLAKTLENQNLTGAASKVSQKILTIIQNNTSTN